MAEERLDAGIEAVRRGETVSPRDHKVPYNGADGVPIREEIVQRHGETIITRNSYGALCLNTPDILFADIDEQDQVIGGLGCLGGLILMISVFLQFMTGLAYAVVIGLVVWIVLLVVQAVLDRVVRQTFGSRVSKLVGSWVGKHPGALARLYRTPAGYRVILIDRPIDPLSEEALAALYHFRSDPIYIQMCRRQACFRARVTPKPWRIGLKKQMRRAVWPIQPVGMPAREEWVRQYVEQSTGYSACTFIGEFGTGSVCSEARQVVAVHDHLAQALSDQPIA